jgi:prepilin-type N-terminal cleavage/methylation domain-containing protein
MFSMKNLRFRNLRKRWLGFNQRGLTLIELLISVTIGLIITGAGLELYLNQHKTWIIEEQISEMQQSGRASIDELSRKIMMSGYKLPRGVNPIIASNTNPDTITILFRNEGLCDATIEWPMPQPSSELRCDGHDVSCFKDNTWAFIYDPNTLTGEFFYITWVQTGSSHIQHNTMDLSKCYPAGSQVMMVDFYKYYLDITTDANHPSLIRVGPDMTPWVFAENIEELQFRYGLANGVYVDVPAIGNIVREVQISLRARTSRQDLQLPDYRKRTFASSVKVRNLGL